MALGLLALLAGCSNLSKYDGTFTGGVVGTDDASCSGGSCSFIRKGFPAGTTLTLVFDPDLDEGARHVSTSDGAFDTTPLEIIPPLAHDDLSQYEFPGGSRIQNYIFSTHPLTGPLAGREPTVYISLMEDDQVEARIIAGNGDYFGVFILDKK